MSLTHIPTTLTNGKWVLCPDKWNCMIFIENSQVIFKGSFHLQYQILLLIIPSIKSSLAKRQIEGGTKQKQNSIDSIEPGTKISWKRMILWFGDKCYDTGYNPDLLMLPGLMPRWFSFFSAQDTAQHVPDRGAEQPRTQRTKAALTSQPFCTTSSGPPACSLSQQLC